MSLPKLSIPTYNVVLPSTGKKVLMKSLTAKEFKLLLVAKETNNLEQMIVTMKQLLRNCIQDQKIDVNKMYIFDAEYLFIHMMTASTAERRPQLYYKCKNLVTDEEGNEKQCNATNGIMPDLHSAEIKMPEKTEYVITGTTESGEDIMMTFRFPTVGSLENVISSNDPSAVIANCMVQVATKDSVNILGRDYTIEDSAEFITGMTDETLQQISQFFDTVPKLTIQHKFKCKECGFDHSIKLEGIKDFFM